MKSKNVLKAAQSIFDYYKMNDDEKPLILFGENAKRFCKDYLKNKGFSPLKTFFMIKNTNGAFLHENLNHTYIEENFTKYMKENNFNLDCYKNGVVCLFKLKLSTLAHEIRHSYQLNNPQLNQFMMIEKYKMLENLYSKFYVYYPNEQDAFYETLKYLKHNKNKIMSDMYLLKITCLELRYAFKTKRKQEFLNGITVKTFKKSFSI